MAFSDEHLAILLAHEPILHHSLKRCYIRPFDPNYEDFLQEARIIFLTTIRDYDRPYETQEDWGRFVGYVSQRLYWRILTLLRPEITFKERHLLLDSKKFRFLTRNFSKNDMKAVDEADFLDWLRTHLTPSEQRILNEVILDGERLGKFAEKHGIAAKTLYRHRQILHKKLHDLLEVSKN